VEAISHLRTGLQWLQTLPETHERLQREVDMLIALGASLIATKGPTAPEVEHTYFRAHHLCAHLEAPHQLFPVWRGLWNHYLIRAELQRAQALSEQLLSLAQHAQDSAMLVAAHAALGRTLMYVGAVTSAHTHFLQGMALYDPHQHRASAFLHGEDAGVNCQGFAARMLWHLGYPDQGLAQSQAAVTLAQQSADSYSLSSALHAAAVFHHCRRDVRATQERAAATIRLATEQGFPHWRAMSVIMQGWALVQQGQAQEGMAQMTQGLQAYQATGAAIRRPHFLALLAEAHRIAGHPDTGLTILTEALALVDTTGERWYEPELYRLKGELLLQQNSDNHTEAASCFQQALAIARRQQAKSWELRAATSLSRLWQQQDKRDAARQLLAPIYGWFTEGFDTADLQEAKALLDELA